MRNGWSRLTHVSRLYPAFAMAMATGMRDAGINTLVAKKLQVGTIGGNVPQGSKAYMLLCYC